MSSARHDRGSSTKPNDVHGSVTSDRSSIRWVALREFRPVSPPPSRVGIRDYRLSREVAGGERAPRPHVWIVCDRAEKGLQIRLG